MFKNKIRFQKDGTHKSEFVIQNKTIEQLTKEVAKGSGITFGGNIVGKAATFGLHILLGRVLGPVAYGLYALGTSVTGIALSISTLGLKHGIIRFCAIYRGKGDSARVKGTILTALVISSLSSLLITGILFVFSSMIAQKFFHEPDLTWVLRIFSLALPFYVLMGVTSSFAQSFRKIYYQQGVLNIFKPIVNLCLVGFAFLLGFQLAGAIYGFLISGVLSAGLGFYFMRKIFPEAFSISKATYQSAQLLRFSLPMFLIGISYLLLIYTDRIMLGFFGKASDVGIYNAASVTALQMTIFLSTFINIFSPMVSELYHQSKNPELENLFKIVTKWVFSLTLPLFIVVTIFSKNIMLLFGSDFVIGWKLLIILAFAQLVNAGTGPVGILLQMTGRQNIDFINGVVLLLGNIGLNVWLIPIYGVLGAASATGISLIFIHLIRLVEVAKILNMIPYDKRYTKPLLAGVITMLIGTFLKLRFLNLTSLIWILAGMGILLIFYILILYAMGLEQEDKIVLSAFRKKFLKANFEVNQ